MGLAAIENLKRRPSHTRAAALCPSGESLRGLGSRGPSREPPGLSLFTFSRLDPNVPLGHDKQGDNREEANYLESIARREELEPPTLRFDARGFSQISLTLRESSG